MQDTWCVYRHISPSNYESVTEASNVVGVSAKAIRNCCNGGYYCRNRDTYINVRQSGGFIWKWCNKEKGAGI